MTVENLLMSEKDKEKKKDRRAPMKMLKYKIPPYFNNNQSCANIKAKPSE